jgi:pimeloyl-ACP methyl ester carboxylesterase
MKSGVCETNGIRIHYLRTGAGKAPIVFRHGLLGSGACWTPVARPLEGSFDIVMPDARGHGASSAPSHGYRYDDHASDVLGLLRSLSAPPILVGHSMGGLVAALVASRHPESLRGLVLVDPTFLSPERQREVYESDVAEQHRRALERSRSELIEEARARHPRRSLEIIELQVDARRKTHHAAFEVLIPPNPDYRDVVSTIEAPTLLVIGDQPVVTLEIANELRDRNSRIETKRIPNAGHGLPFDQPERLAEVVAAKFLRAG